MLSQLLVTFRLSVVANSTTFVQLVELHATRLASSLLHFPEGLPRAAR